MAKIMNDNFQINVGNPIDSKYLNSSNQPYANVAAVNTAIVQSQRYVGLTVNVANVEYWYHLGVTDGDLVIKDSGIASTGITTAINGLTKVGNAVRLGGTITGTTTLTDSRGTPSGLLYGGDYSANFVLNSIPDWRSIVTVTPTGKTGAFSLTLPMLGKSVIVTSATPVNVTIPTNASVPFPVGAIITIQQGGAGVVTAVGASGVTVNGVVLSTTKQYAFVQYWQTAINTWSVIGGAIELWQTSGSSLIVPVDSNKRVPVQFISGLTQALSGYVCTANNGLTKYGQNVVLGGSLTGNTSILPSTSCFWIGGNGSMITALMATCGNYINIGSQGGGSCTVLKSSQNLLTLSAGTALFCGYTNHGINYAEDYSSTFTARSIPDAQWVTGKTSTSGIQSVNNGLTKYGTNAVLGGQLTGNTTIQACANCFDICGAHVCMGMDNSASECFYVCTKSFGYNKIGMSAACTDFITSNSSGTGAMTLCADHFNLGFDCEGIVTDTHSPAYGLQYGGDYENTFVARSLATAQYVTGKTCNIACKANKNIASQGQIIFRDSTQLTGSTDMIYCEAQESVSIGCGNTASGLVSGAFGGWNNTAGGTNSVTLGGCNNQASAVCSSIVGGRINCICSTALRSAIIGGQNITLTGATYNDTVAVDCLAIICPPSGTGNLLCLDSVTGKVGVTSLSAFGGLTGATNGLHTSAQDVHLGGNLIECTHIEGAFCFDIDAVRGFNVRTSGNTDMNIDAQDNGGFTIKSQSGSFDTFGNYINAVGFYGHFDQPQGFAIYDNRPGTGATGIVYANDYSANYVNRSLVDKQYVDSIATGLNVHAAVLVATTVPIVLSGSPKTIDGISVGNGTRVLVKNQASGATNGIYVVASGVWSRATDYDGAPSGEVSNGDLIPVTSGLTQNNELWALTTLNPITVGVTPLTFSLFSSIIDVQAGNGIDVVMLGGVHTVSVQLASNCGLTFCGTGLAVNSNIAGNGLGWSAGVLNVNAASCPSNPAIPVGYNAGDCLVVACSDLRSAVSAITGATNGLTSSSCVVKLGGNLCETTTVSGVNTYGLNITGLTTFNLGFGAGNVNAIITDSSVTPRGLQYVADYSSTFLSNSLVNKQYVDNCTACASAISLKAITGVTNGLTKYACHDACLGGALTTNLVFTNATSGQYGVCFGTGNSCRIDNFLVYSDNIVGLLSQTRMVIGNANSGGTGGVQSLSFCGASGSVVRDDCQSKGLVYANNYEANFSQYSLVDAGYVTGKTSQGITTANNGLTKLGQNVVLGGALTGTTIIKIGPAKYLQFSGCSIGGGTHTAYGVFADNYVQLQSRVPGTFMCSQFDLNSDGEYTLQHWQGGNGVLLEGICGGMFIADPSASNKCLLQYFSDYESSMINPRQIPDLAYVTGKTSTSGIQSANNGLTKTGTTVQLGGCLIKETVIEQCLNNFCIVHTDPFGPQEISFAMCASNNNIKLGAKDSGAHETGVVLDFSQFTIYTQSAATFQGFTYCNGFTSAVGNKQSCSVPDIAWVKSCIGAFTGITTTAITNANNGLTKLGQNVVLGGALTGNSNVGLNGHNFDVTGGTNFGLHLQPTQATLGRYNVGSSNYVHVCDDSAGSVELNATNGYYKSNVGLVSSWIELSTCHISAAKVSALQIKDNSVEVCSTCTTFEGVKYCQDFSTNYTPRTLPDVAWVTGKTSTSGIQSVNNGLTKHGTNAVLGGQLTGNTCVGLGACCIIFSGTSSCGASISSTAVCIGDLINAGSYIAVGGGMDITVKCGSHNLNICNTSTGVYGNVNISATRAVNITASGITLQTTPPAGLTSDAVIVWNSTDKQLKSVAGSSLGDKNNIYARTTITGNTTLNSGSSYVILANHASPITITLPATPQNGQAFKLKDTSGNALTNNITVSGNGKNIDGNGSAAINTDFGALEIVFDAGLNAWFTLAFIN